MKSKKGFTLIEIMIVFVVMGLLAAMAIPAFMKVRFESQIKQSVNAVYADYEDHYSIGEIEYYSSQLKKTFEPRGFEKFVFEKELRNLLNKEVNSPRPTIVEEKEEMPPKQTQISKTVDEPMSEYESIKLKNKVDSLENKIESLERQIKELKNQRKY